MFILWWRRRLRPADVLISLGCTRRPESPPPPVAPHGAALAAGSYQRAALIKWEEEGEKKNLRFSILHAYRIYLQFTSEMFADESGLNVFWTLFGNFNHLLWERRRGEKKTPWTSFSRCVISEDSTLLFHKSLKHFCINTLKGGWKAYYETLNVSFSPVLHNLPYKFVFFPTSWNLK